MGLVVTFSHVRFDLIDSPLPSLAWLSLWLSLQLLSVSSQPPSFCFHGPVLFSNLVFDLMGFIKVAYSSANEGLFTGT